MPGCEPHLCASRQRVHQRRPPIASIAIVLVSMAGSIAPVIRIRVLSRTPRRSGYEPAGQSAQAPPQSALLQSSPLAATVEAAAVAIHTVRSNGSQPTAPPRKRWRWALAKPIPIAPSLPRFSRQVLQTAARRATSSCSRSSPLW
jgi:hypothetical protein